jgi:hypothetical protein
MDVYPLFVFEVNDLPSPFRNERDVIDFVERLRQEEDESGKNLPPDPRFLRLGKRLAQLLPEDFWPYDPEVALSECKKIWWPELGADHMKELLKVLLPLARELHLGIFDAMFAIYVPPETNKAPIPRCKEALQYRFEFDPDFVEKKPFTKESVDEYIDMTLTPILAEHGFVRHPQYSCKFQRKINGGHQKIFACPVSYTGPLTCSVQFSQYSERITAIRDRYNDFDKGERINRTSDIFFFYLFDLREGAQPGWKNLETWAEQLVLTKEEADWMIEDILQMGLSILDRLRNLTVEDADRFFNGRHEWTELVEKTRSITSATIYARLAGKMDFETVVRHYEQRIQDKDVKERYARLADICRREIHPVNGSEPA